MNLETKITIYKFTPQVFTLTRKQCVNKLFELVMFTHRTSVKLHAILYHVYQGR